MEVVIIKYNAGNIQSVLYALERIGVNAVVTDDVEKIKAADKVIFPGVGEASTAMRYLKERKLDAIIKDLRQPVFGICLGMQLMCRYSEENDTHCMGIFNESVKWFGKAGKYSGDDDFIQVRNSHANADSLITGKIEPAVRLKVPQIGWNNVYNLKTELFNGLPQNSFCYFVHGYYASIGEHTIATTDYIIPYSSGLHRDNFYGVQFHPEKSASAGEKILKNFLSL